MTFRKYREEWRGRVEQTHRKIQVGEEQNSKDFREKSFRSSLVQQGK
jgi:hypothetical protein